MSIHDLVFETTRTRFPDVKFTREITKDDHYVITVHDFDFYCDSKEFSEFLNNVAEDLLFDDYMKLDFVTPLGE